VSDQIASLAMSKPEEFYARALVQAGFSIRQQVVIGVRGARGSQMIDIVIDNLPPNKVAVYIDGSYWHRRTQVEDAFERSRAKRMGYWVVEVPEEDASSIEAAKAHAKRTFGGKA
jgi:G:T-mismatch repair DNA endonuclease (very short patch repair protein)